MTDPERQTAAGKVLWHFTMSLDGFVAGPSYSMGWMTGTSVRPGLVEEYAGTTGAVLGGRRGFDAHPEVGIYGGAWQGPVFVLTHNPGGAPVRLERLNADDPAAAVNVRYHPVAAG